MSQLKKLISLLLSIVIILGLCSFNVFAEDNAITVYITMSKYGEILTDREGNDINCVAVELAGQESYTLDDLFFKAHELFYDGGAEEGYFTEIVDPWGLSVTKFWGDTSGNFGYQVNGATEAVLGPSHLLEDNDIVDAYILTSFYESYAKFNKISAETVAEKPIELQLLNSCYDAEYNMYFEPCIGATVTLNGMETDLLTDGEGKVTLSFDEEGEYIISAKKTREISTETYTAITYPFCVVTVQPNNAFTILHNIAEKYSSEEIIADGNMPWLVADMAVYEYLYPDNGNGLSEEIRQMCVDKLVREAASATAPGTLSKNIIALRALGYDAKRLHTFLHEEFDAVAPLISLIDDEDSSVTNIYTLPYVIIALNQGAGYCMEEQMSYLLEAAVSSKEAWLDTTWGTDSITPMILALAPYYDINVNVKDAIDEAVEVIYAFQGENGGVGNAASCGLAMAGFSALDIDSYSVCAGEYSLIDGLLSQANGGLDAFLPTTNSFSTEQGFRGLLAWRLHKEETGKMMYDFSSNPLEEAYATGVVNCPVTINAVPSGANISIEGETPVFENTFDLSEGTYTYTVSKAGYYTKKGEFTVTADEAQNHIVREIEITLNERSSGGGGSHTKETYTVTFETNGGSNVAKQQIEENEKAQKPHDPQKDGYIFAGWFADKDLRNEYDFSQNVDKNIVLYAKWDEKPAEKIEFPDVLPTSWYFDAVSYVSNRGIMQGTENGFEPENEMTRAMLVTVLYRLENNSDASYQNVFADVETDAWYYDSVLWAADNGIVNGVGDGLFAPDKSVTRQEMAAILYRYALIKGYDGSKEGELQVFADHNEISSWATEALLWANGKELIKGTSEITISPKETATRAQVATILMRFCENTDK